ncbi:MAG: hypothetical protein M0C28_32200 [Candidatus Moduliflexus flocculans]|nr:hypothetical protein [Candidatus Moduliflexus flocculans]
MIGAAPARPGRCPCRSTEGVLWPLLAVAAVLVLRGRPEPRPSRSPAGRARIPTWLRKPARSSWSGARPRPTARS